MLYPNQKKSWSILESFTPDFSVGFMALIRHSSSSLHCWYEIQRKFCRTQDLARKLVRPRTMRICDIRLVYLRLKLACWPCLPPLQQVKEIFRQWNTYRVIFCIAELEICGWTTVCLIPLITSLLCNCFKIWQLTLI